MVQTQRHSQLYFPAFPGDQILKMNVNGTWTTYTLNINGTGVWSPSEPSIAVGEAFMSSKNLGLWWRRNVLIWP